MTTAEAAVGGPADGLAGDAPATGRRFLVAIGVGTYTDTTVPPLPGVPHDVTRLRGLLEPMGYETVLPELAADPTAQQLREGIGTWAAEAELGPDDVVVLYFAGHGVKDLDRHYLLCSTSVPDSLDATALPSEDLGRALVKSEVGQLLIVLDTCYAAEGAGDIGRTASQLARFRRGAAGRWLLASARSKDRARENAFVDALTEVLHEPRLGVLPEFVGVREVTHRVNKYFAAERLTQQARLSTIESDGYAPFFRNKDHIPALAGRALDGDTLLRLRRQTRGHFETRGRGVGSLEEKGDYFTGRTAVLDELTDWLDAPHHDGRARIVTGDPGSGKSAVLGRLLGRTADQHQVVQLHARHATLEDLTAVLAEVVHKPGAALEDLLGALGERDAAHPVTVLVDALDEAGAAGDTREGRLVAQRLLRPMSALPAVRLIVGTRRSLLTALGAAVDVIDLDQRVSGHEIAEYATKLLLDAADPTSASPYRGAPEAAGRVAHGIASRAGTSFLVARMTARALIREPQRIDTAVPGWEGRLPSSADDAFEAYLKQFGSRRPLVERLLTPLAYAQGAGLPWSTVWSAVAEALSGEPCSEEELRWLHEHAGSYVVETRTATGDSAFRLFHESLAEYLRRRGPADRAAHRAVTEALLGQVRPAPETGVRDWATAHPYLRDHLATHAAAGGVLDDLLGDTEFLLHAAPAHLVRVLDRAVTPEHRRRAAVYRASYAAHADAAVHERRDILAIDAARYGDNALSGRFARGRAWLPRWATGGLIDPALRGTLRDHPRLVRAVDHTVIDGRPHVVTGVFGEGGLGVWDLTDSTCRMTLTGHTDTVSALSCVDVDGVPHAVSGSEDGTVRLWNLAEEREVLCCLVGGPVETLKCATVDGRLRAAVLTRTSLRVWDLVDGTPHSRSAEFELGLGAATVVSLGGHAHLVAPPGYGRRAEVRDLITGKPWRRWRSRRFRRRAGQPYALASTVIDGDPCVAVCGYEQVELWNLATGARRFARQVSESGFPTAAVCAPVDGRPHLLVSYDKTVHVWNLLDGTQRAALTGHTEDVKAITCVTLDGRPHAVTGGGDGVRIWDLTDATSHTPGAGHTHAVESVSCVTIDGRPHAVTGDQSGTVLLWPLATDTPGPTKSADINRWVSASCCTTIDGEPHAVLGTPSGRVYLWNLAGDREPERIADGTGWVYKVACTELEGHPHALWAVDGAVHVWDLLRAAPRAQLAISDNPRGLACTDLEGRPHALTSTLDDMSVWDLTDGSERTEQYGGSVGGVHRLVCFPLDGRPHALIARYDGVVVQALDGSTHGTVLDSSPRHDVRALAYTTIDGRPHAVVAFRAEVTGRGEYGVEEKPTLQIWDLTTLDLVETIHLPLPTDTVAAHGPDIVIGMADEVVVLTRARPHP
ncbi:caspase family protein [Streptomyces sp. NPDC096205]|uniref:caspase family protein n=1 Tax=Streptomyces sp. NPDC096205 TaxID=3366081 RepID=UPI003811276B